MSVNDTNGNARQTVQSHRPLWMAHWMRKSSNTSPVERRDHSGRTEQELDRISGDVDLTIGLKPSSSVKEPVPKTKIFDAVNEGLGTSSKSLGNDGIYSTSNNPLEWTETYPSTHIVPYRNLGKHELDKGKAVLCPLLEQERCHKQKQPKSDTSINACFKDFNTTMLFGHDWFQKMQKHSGIRFLPSQTEEDKSYNKPQFDFYSLKRICTTVDSVEATPEGCPRFSQTTHSMLITEKTSDVNPLQEKNDVFRATRLVKKMNENTSRDLTLSPFFGQRNRGVKLQALSSSSNSEGRDNIRNLKGRKVTIKNESSAETDTMEMDFFKAEKPSDGANSTPSTKAFNAIGSSREIEHQWTKTGLPDMNLELPALPAIENSPDYHCPSSSRTQSLEMEMLMANTEHTKTKPIINLDDDSDPSNRWVKRLKLMNSSNSSSQGTKTSNPAENSSHDKTRKYFRSILDSGGNSSGPSLRNNHHGKEIIQSGKSGEFTVDTVKKNRDLLLSHAWIKRWLRNGSRITEEKPNQSDEKVGERKDFKMAIDDDDLQKKQFPSIAAMAMMGKAMGGFQSCELQKRGPFTVWNTKTF